MELILTNMSFYIICVILQTKHIFYTCIRAIYYFLIIVLLSGTIPISLPKTRFLLKNGQKDTDFLANCLDFIKKRSFIQILLWDCLAF